MLQSMGLQRVGHNLATEQHQWRAKCPTREKWRIIHRGCESRKTGHWVKENPWQKLQSWGVLQWNTGNSNRPRSTPSDSTLFFWFALLKLFPYFQQKVLHSFFFFFKISDIEEFHGWLVLRLIHLNWRALFVVNTNQVNLQLTTLTLLWERSQP